jgi:hypothetical protein
VIFIPRHHGGIDEHIAITLAEWNNAHVVDLWHRRHLQVILKHNTLPQFIKEHLQRWGVMDKIIELLSGMVFLSK